MTFDPKQTQFVRARPGTFDEKVNFWQSRFEQALDHPIVIAALTLTAYAAVVGAVAGFLGWWP